MKALAVVGDFDWIGVGGSVWVGEGGCACDKKSLKVERGVILP